MAKKSLIIVLTILMVLLTHLFSNKSEVHKFQFTAFILEPRPHTALEYVVVNFLENLDNRWKIIVFHGNKNKQFVAKMVENNLKEYRYRLDYIDLKVDNLNADTYSDVLKEASFYDHFDTEQLLIFQTDSLICQNYSSLIYDYMEYDYVGPPYPKKWKWAAEFDFVGNGGLTLRRKSKLLEIIKYCKSRGSKDHDDQYFPRGCENHRPKKPSYEKAQHFGIRAVYTPPPVFGHQKSWYFFKGDEFDKIASECPGLDKLRQLCMSYKNATDLLDQAMSTTKMPRG